MERTELRYIYDCENMNNILQFRYVTENSTTPWQNVPVLFSTVEECDLVQKSNDVNIR